MNNTMKAAILEQFNQDLVVKQIPIPIPKKGEILIKVKASGLCRTDLHIQAGRLKSVKIPLIPGHETAGEVWRIGEDVAGFEVGDAVIVAIDVICNACRYCITGRGNLCTHLVRLGFELNGGHEEYMIVPSANLVKFDKNKVPYEKAAIIPDAVVTMYHAIKDQGKVRASDRICILGVGGLGLQGVQIAKYFGAEVYCTSRRDERLNKAKEYGADYLINTNRDNLIETVSRLTDGEMCDVVFDNIGIRSSVQTSLDICRPGGKVVMVGYSEETFNVQYQNTIMKEKEIIGIRGTTLRDLVEIVHIIENGHVDPYVSKTYTLDEINKALKDLKEGIPLGRTVILM